MDSNDLNNLSEVESLSDSDWLDISSRASEDNDSLDDSDREDLASDYRPPSRRSLASFGSSREGEIQGWEGIIEDGSDEVPPAASPEVTEEDAAIADPILQLSQQSLSFRMVALSEAAVARHAALDDPEEDRKVKDGLDQSMVSTLSASRSNSLNASVQTSVVHSRDLRLSFPDPLTSTSPGAHSVSPSYEDITADTDIGTGTGIALSDRETETEGSTDVVTAPAAVPGSTTTPTDARVVAGARTEIHSSAAVDFNIVLYGTSSETKHRVVHRLLEKLMAATQCGFSSLPPIDVPQNIRALLTGGRSAHPHYTISIVDRTENVLSIGGKEVGRSAYHYRPSLAIVFLPSANIIVPDHTLYLPVLHNQDELEKEGELTTSGDRLLDAEHQWDGFGIVRSRLISHAFTSGRSAVVEEEEIEEASPAKVRRALRPLLPWSEQWARYHLASRHAFTLFAILSIVLGYLVNGSLPLPGMRRASPTLGMVARPAPTPIMNASLPAPATSPSSVGLIASSLKDFAFAAVSPYAVASTSSVATKAIPSSTTAPAEDADRAGAPSVCACGCGLITWPEKFRPTTDLVLRPTPPTPALSNQAFTKGPAFAVIAPPPTSAKGKGKARATDAEDESLYALSTRLAGALSEYFDMRMMFTQTRSELQEIMDALDDLTRAINEQTGGVLEQSKATIEVVRENIRARHERAKTRAKELRAAGERLFSSVSERVRGRVSTAKENARVLRENVRMRREDSNYFRKERREARRERKQERRAERAERRARRAQSV
ncbi:hypothetical protein DICSQDRAFT_100420 [Dichomitus squalens LYAD-421 SS1]|uniref:uncharacterized protein n=1 Tax=Dichomitus squalens (strain LYAD-421) TaxID=732165 RepID=UPI0004415FEA|nr:uncharacterized protein DICSQDRAFT_100420 [Dichomitus squalens LYAD-421 SS1]EJF64936.1 hypothetical protein DICSQDRAFT_100420 [Dichomitus squalens LYAD-421 SS1]